MECNATTGGRDTLQKPDPMAAVVRSGPDMAGYSGTPLAKKLGLVDNKVCAIDDTWSGLRLVIRLKDR